MCGIAGIFNFKNELVDEKVLLTMMKAMKHRGPDDEGLYLASNVGLGHVRLSIIDLSYAGHQPMFSNDKRYCIVYNGEVYNYLELKKELSSHYIFKTKTDTEVILAAYIHWGKNCLNKFNGDFAFVLFDLKTHELFGARDRFGVKPLYYYLDSNRLIFASEIKSILPLVERKPNDKIIYDYLLFNRTDHTNETFFTDIKKLQHGHYFFLKNLKFKVTEWYKLRDKISVEKYISPEDYKLLLFDSLKLRLRADVEVGVSLSGGIDSSSIVAALVKNFGLSDLNTFSAIYGKNEIGDESSFINEFIGIVDNCNRSTIFQKKSRKKGNTFSC